MNARRPLAAFVPALLCLLLAGVAGADGGFFPPQVFQKPAAIPSQRALIVFRDGVETLVIESSFHTEAKEAGWVIPLPATPTRVEPMSSAAFKTLSFCLQPEITHYLPEWAALVLVFVIPGLPLFALGLIFGRKAVTFTRLKDLLLLVVVCATLAGMLLPSLARARSDPGPSVSVAGVSVEQQARAGAYTVTVLQAEKPENLDAWLRANGFMTIPAEGQAIVAGYIQQGWRFAVARIERDQGGLSKPHPVLFEFPAKEAVYPMRLTALAGSTPRLELFLVGAERASSPLLDTEFCDVFREETEYWSPPSDAASASTSGHSRYFTGAYSRQATGHPELIGLLWPGCVVTKLSGALRPGQMKDDLRFTWPAFKPERRHVFTHQGARFTALTVGAGLFLLAGLVSCTLLRKRASQPGGRWWFAKKALPPAALASAVVGLVLYLALPKVEAHVASGKGISRMGALSLALRLELSADTPVEEAIKEAKAALTKGEDVRNFYTGEPIVVGEASPGNFTFRLKDGCLYFVYHLLSGGERWDLLANQRLDWRLATDPHTSGYSLRRLAAHGRPALLVHIARHPNAPLDLLETLAQNPDKTVAEAAAKAVAGRKAAREAE